MKQHKKSNNKRIVNHFCYECKRCVCVFHSRCIWFILLLLHLLCQTKTSDATSEILNSSSSSSGNNTSINELCQTTQNYLTLWMVGKINARAPCAYNFQAHRGYVFQMWQLMRTLTHCFKCTLHMYEIWFDVGRFGWSFCLWHFMLFGGPKGETVWMRGQRVRDSRYTNRCVIRYVNLCTYNKHIPHITFSFPYKFIYWIGCSTPHCFFLFSLCIFILFVRLLLLLSHILPFFGFAFFPYSNIFSLCRARIDSTMCMSEFARVDSEWDRKKQVCLRGHCMLFAWCCILLLLWVRLHLN